MTSGATGTVTFKDGSTTIGTGTISGTTATYSTSSLTGGTHSITAVYGGDTNYATSTSSVLTQVVTTASSTTSLGSSANPSTFGSSVTFTATVTSGATGTVTFKDGSTTLGTGTISGTTATYSTSSLTGGTHSITAVYGGDSNYAGSTSSAVSQVVSTVPVVTTQPASTTVNAGATATFSAAATASPAPTVKWQLSTDGGSNWSDIGGATSTTYTTPLTTSTYSGNQYRAVFPTTAGSTSSSAATLTVLSAPVITGNPTSQTVTSGATVTFTAAGTGTPAPTVQWQISTNGGTSWTNITGATSTSYTTGALTTANDGTQYRATFLNSQGSVVTSSAVVRVNQAPVMVTQPASVTVNTGGTASFTATATGTPSPTVQWQKSTNGGSTWTDISGATSTTYTTPATVSGDNGTKYHAVFTNTLGSVTSAAATLTATSVATVSSTAVGWGTQTANLVDMGDGRLLPSGRTTSIPWLNITKITLTLNQSIASLLVGNVTVKGVSGTTYAVSSVTGSGTTWTINLAGSGLANPDRVTVTVTNASIATFSKRLDVLPGDVNDDGVVNSLDTVDLRNKILGVGPMTVPLVFMDINGDGTANATDLSLITARNGKKLP